MAKSSDTWHLGTSPRDGRAGQNDDDLRIKNMIFYGFL